jgi:hypothetical protein
MLEKERHGGHALKTTMCLRRSWETEEGRKIGGKTEGSMRDTVLALVQ